MAKTRYPGIYTRETKRGLVYDATASYHGQQKQARGHLTLGLAKASQMDMLTDMRDGRIGRAPASLTVGDYLQKRWLRYAETRLQSAESVRSYRQMVAKIVDTIGDIRLSTLTPLDVEDLNATLAKSGQTTAHLAFGRLKQALRQAVKWELLGRNPCDQVDAPRKPKHASPVLDSAAINRLLGVADATPYGALVYVALVTGLRWSELVALGWADVDFAEGLLHVRQSKSPSGVRAVALGPVALERLRVHRMQQMRVYVDAGRAPGPLVFITETGARLNQGNFHYRWWQHIRANAGQPALRFHDLRHIQGTLLARARVSPAVAKDRLGHANIATTMDIYTDVLADDQRPGALAIEALLGRA